MILGVSGTPGCGKTTLAKILAEESSYVYIDVTSFVKEKKIYDEYDDETQSYIVDIDKLEKELLTQLDPNTSYIIDSHMAQDMSFIDRLIVCTCELPILKKRLESREYSREKIQENLDAEIFDICFIDGIENGIDATKVDCTYPLTKERKNELISSLL